MNWCKLHLSIYSNENWTLWRLSNRFVDEWKPQKWQNLWLKCFHGFKTNFIAILENEFSIYHIIILSEHIIKRKCQSAKNAWMQKVTNKKTHKNKNKQKTGTEINIKCHSLISVRSWKFAEMYFIISWKCKYFKGIGMFHITLDWLLIHYYIALRNRCNLNHHKDNWNYFV